MLITFFLLFCCALPVVRELAPLLVPHCTEFKTKCLSVCMAGREMCGSSNGGAVRGTKIFRANECMSLAIIIKLNVSDLINKMVVFFCCRCCHSCSGGTTFFLNPPTLPWISTPWIQYVPFSFHLLFCSLVFFLSSALPLFALLVLRNGFS